MQNIKIDYVLDLLKYNKTKMNKSKKSPYNYYIIDISKNFLLYYDFIGDFFYVK